MREFFRYYFLKVLLVIVVLQLAFFFWLEKRNHRPEAMMDEVSVFEGYSVKIRPLRNDTDKDEEDTLALSMVAKPLYGEIEQTENRLEYSIDKGFAGIDSFTYVISDGKKESKETYIKVIVKENLPPVIQNDVIVSYPDNKVQIAVLGNDKDQEGDSIFVKDFTDPLHGKLTKSGNILYYAPNSNFAVTDSFQYTASDGFTDSKKGTVIVKIKSKSSPEYPWLSADVGQPGKPGSFSKSGDKIKIIASGSDIWARNDNAHFAYQKIEGDFEIVTKVKQLDDTDMWAKGGIMIRESAAGSSKNGYIALTHNDLVTCQIRFNNNDNTTNTKVGNDIKAPYWVKLTRKGNQLTGYMSTNGIDWNEVRSDEVDMPKIALVGLAVTSHNDEKLCTAIFEKTRLIKK